MTQLADANQDYLICSNTYYIQVIAQLKIAKHVNQFLLIIIKLMKAIFISFISLITLATTQNDCAWTDNRGLIYNFTQIDKPDAWQIQDNSKSEQQMFSMVYVFNFCDFSNVKCHRKKVAAYEALSVMGQLTDNCDIAGQPQNRTISHLNAEQPDEGIQIEFSDGDLCVELDSESEKVQDAPMTPRSIRFEIECAEDGVNDETWKIIESLGCKDVLRMRHRLGCRPGQFDKGSGALTIVVVLLLLVLVKYGHNRSRGLSGVDAVPLLVAWPWQQVSRVVSKQHSYQSV